MRYILFLIALGLFLPNRGASGQVRKNAFELGVGYASTESGQPMYYGEYTRRLSSRVHLAVLGGYTAGTTDTRPMWYSTSSIWIGDVTCYYSPLSRLKSSSLLRSVFRLHTLQLGLGAGIRRLDYYRIIGSSIVGQPPDQFSEDRKNRWGPGLSLALEYEVARHKEWFAALRAAIHVFDGGEAVRFAGLNLGRNF